MLFVTVFGKTDLLVRKSIIAYAREWSLEHRTMLMATMSNEAHVIQRLSIELTMASSLDLKGNATTILFFLLTN